MRTAVGIQTPLLNRKRTLPVGCLVYDSCGPPTLLGALTPGRYEPGETEYPYEADNVPGQSARVYALKRESNPYVNQVLASGRFLIINPGIRKLNSILGTTYSRRKRGAASILLRRSYRWGRTYGRQCILT